jgi:hypothetical protein
VHFRLTNTSPDTITISISRRPKFSDGFQLTLIPKSKDEEMIDDGVLRIYVQEEPLFLHDPKLPFRTAKQAFSQEKKFLAFWFIVLMVCAVKTLQYGGRREGDRTNLN